MALDKDRAIIIPHVHGSMGVYTHDGRSYIRYGPTTQIMPRMEYERRVLEKLHSHRRWENELTPDWVSIGDLDEDEIQATLYNATKLGRMRAPSHADTESILRGLGLFDDGRLINTAVALYGKNERLFSHYPQLSLRVCSKSFK